MKKAAVWIATLSAVTLVISMSAMGIGVYEMDEEIIRISAYIALPCLALSFIATVVLRFSSSRCAFCGRQIPANAAYCPYCGKKQIGGKPCMITAMLSIGQVHGAEIWLAGWLLCAILYFALLLIQRTNRTRANAKNVVFGFLSLNFSPI